MNADLITAATNALRELKHAHEHHYPHVLCLGRHLCPCANAIAELEAELGMAEIQAGDQCPKVWGYELWEHMSREHGLTLMDSELHEIIDIAVKLKATEDPEFQAVDTTSLGAADPSDVAHAALRASQQIGARFLPGTRLCCQCECPLPSTTHADISACERCLES